MFETGTTSKQRKNGTAKRVRHTAECPPDIVPMTTVTCDQCGARFEIDHPLAYQDAALATRQAAWLADQLVWDHIQQNKHRGTQNLPPWSEMK